MPFKVYFRHHSGSKSVATAAVASLLHYNRVYIRGCRVYLVIMEKKMETTVEYDEFLFWDPKFMDIWHKFWGGKPIKSTHGCLKPHGFTPDLPVHARSVCPTKTTQRNASLQCLGVGFEGFLQTFQCSSNIGLLDYLVRILAVTPGRSELDWQVWI